MSTTTVTKLKLTDKLPLTCSRTGTCCQGKLVRLNPWELSKFAEAKKISVKDFIDKYCEFGGVKLRFDGALGWKNQAECSQYIPNFGCSVHTGRPLACRLFPLGRQKQGEETYYMYQGTEFPCLSGCPEVVDLPQMSVADYITGQETQIYERVQDEYLEVMQDLADLSFALLLETGLSESGDRKTIQLWEKMGNEDPELLTKRIGNEWLDILMAPELSNKLEPIEFIDKHNILLQTKAQESFGELGSLEACRDASVLMMGIALHLGRGLGADPKHLANHWIKTAKKLGSK